MQTLTNMEELLKVLLEGGAAGHMMHPYDKYKDPKDFLNFFKDFLTGKIEGTEKVDGYNLFVGLKNGKIVAARNKNQPPIENITDKFDIKHGAFAGFVAGWKAIKSGLEKLSQADIEKYNLAENFINLEILYGYIPNAVPYSQTTNYIVFHGYVGTPENDWEPQNTENQDARLNALAKKLGSTSVTSSEIIFAGDPEKVVQSSKTVKSYWEFKGPIAIKPEKIKKELSQVAKEWQNYPEVKELKKVTDPGKQFDLMKSITKKIGSEVLQAMVSKLSETGKLVKGHPGMEGIVLKRNGDKVKVTGDFLDYSRPEDIPTVDATKPIREHLQKKILGLPTTTLSRLKEKTFASVHDYVMDKKKKSFNYTLESDIPKEYVDELIDLIDKGQEEIKKVLPEVREKGRTYDERSLLVQSLMLSRFKDKIKSAKIYRAVIDPYARIFYNVKKVE